jgi:phosphatidylethanolamine/phosphatidyl-N-methylethanolamine N-methyltransferase
MSVDAVTFLKELPSRFHEIGAIIPSSRMLAKSMIRPLLESDRPMNILEVGCGTGPCTRELVRNMGTEDNLVACEINPVLFSRMKASLEKEPAYQKHKDRITLYCLPVQDLPGIGFEGSFDFIASSLPFTNFTPSLVKEILASYDKLLKPGGELTFIEYVLIRKLSQVIRTQSERERLRAVDAVMDKWLKQKRGTDMEVTLLNVPPAYTVTVRQ